MKSSSYQSFYKNNIFIFNRSKFFLWLLVNYFYTITNHLLYLHSKGGAIETNLILKMFLKVVCPPMQSEGFMNWNQYFTPP